MIDRAVGSDQDKKFVYVIDAESKVQYRQVKTGSLQEDGLRVINDGLKPGEWVMVSSDREVQQAARQRNPGGLSRAELAQLIDRMERAKANLERMSSASCNSSTDAFFSSSRSLK